MAIVRAPRPTSNFYLLDKTISEDKRLSWAARGLLVFLLGKPDNWSVSVANLVNETKGSAKASGRDAVYGLLNELIAVGYIKRSQKNGTGGFGDIDYLVAETAEPLTEKPETAQPDTGLPLTEKPYPSNPTQTSIDSYQGPSEEQGKKVADAPAKFDPKAALLAEGVDAQVVADFLAHRKAVKATVTATVIAGIKREADRAGWTLEAALSECCQRGWRGFKAEWVNKDQKAVAMPKAKSSDPFDAKNPETWGKDRWGNYCPQKYLADKQRAYFENQASESLGQGELVIDGEVVQ